VNALFFPIPYNLNAITRRFQNQDFFSPRKLFGAFRAGICGLGRALQKARLRVLLVEVSTILKQDDCPITE
jgi:hypothetical protein